MDPHLLRDAKQVIAGLAQLNQQFAGRSVLLTGAGGFLGRHLVHYFLALNDTGTLSRPCRLVAWDNFLRGMPSWLEGLCGRPDLICEKRDVAQRQERTSVDFIIHAASIASPPYYRKHPIQTMDANVAGLRNLLDSAVAQSVAGFLFFSSSEIYGDPDPANIPTAETYRGLVSCTGPRSCYDESKRYGETLCVNFWREFGVPVKIVRPFNNYGPGLNLTDGRVISDFFRDVVANRDVVVLSDGKATRTFCYAADGISGYLRALLSERHGESFNIGTETPEISMLDLAETIIRISGKPLRVTFGHSKDRDYLADNPQRRCPCIGKARSLLGYSPQVTLTDGLARTYKYYLDNPASPAQ